MRLDIRKTEVLDRDDILQWRNDPVSREQSFQSNLISESNHRNWFNQMMVDKKQNAYIGIIASDKTKIGFAHLKNDTAGICTVSVNLNPVQRGKGLGSKLLQKVIEDHSSFNDVVYLALIKSTNLASIRCFEKAGFASYENKSGVVTKTPKWYVDYNHETMFKYQEAATAVSPDMELAVKKAVLLAKAKLVDRINGEMNNRTTITKNEAGTNEDLTVSAGSRDVIVNIIEDTLARGYEVKKQEIFLTKHKSYRAYVMVELSKKEVEAIIEAVNKKKLASIDVDAINKQADEILN